MHYFLQFPNAVFSTKAPAAATFDQAVCGGPRDITPDLAESVQQWNEIPGIWANHENEGYCRSEVDRKSFIYTVACDDVGPYRGMEHDPGNALLARYLIRYRIVCHPKNVETSWILSPQYQGFTYPPLHNPAVCLKSDCNLTKAAIF